jgi:hypothetical protein
MIFTLLTTLMVEHRPTPTSVTPTNHPPITSIPQMKPNSCWQDPTTSLLMMSKYIISPTANSFVGQMVGSIEIVCVLYRLRNVRELKLGYVRHICMRLCMICKVMYGI